MSLTDKLNKTLDEVNKSNRDIVASALVSEDGLMLANALPPGVDPNTIGGTVAVLLQLTNRTAHALEQGRMEQVVVQNEDGFSLITNVTPRASLVLLARRSISMGMLVATAAQASESLSPML